MIHDVIVIGGGPSGLAVGYYLERTSLNYLILDAERNPGGSWQHYWSSLRLFSPAQYSSLPGTFMEGGVDYYADQQEVVGYLENYETKNQLTVKRPVEVLEVHKSDDLFLLKTSHGKFLSKTIVGATGSFRNPWIPDIGGLDQFKGKVVHSSNYTDAKDFVGQRVAVVGEGNSGAQILAELSQVAKTYWITKNPPAFLPEHVDGKYLFNAATQLYEAKRKGRDYIPPSLGEIVMVPGVKAAKERGDLEYYPEIKSVEENTIELVNNQKLEVDAIIFCTGYKSELKFLEKLPVLIKFDKIYTNGTHSREIPGLWMVGYGSWTGFASATLIGVGRSARSTVQEIQQYLS